MENLRSVLPNEDVRRAIEMMVQSKLAGAFSETNAPDDWNEFAKNLVQLKPYLGVIKQLYSDFEHTLAWFSKNYPYLSGVNKAAFGNTLKVSNKAFYRVIGFDGNSNEPNYYEWSLKGNGNILANTVIFLEEPVQEPNCWRMRSSQSVILRGQPIRVQLTWHHYGLLDMSIRYADEIMEAELEDFGQKAKGEVFWCKIANEFQRAWAGLPSFLPQDFHLKTCQMTNIIRVAHREDYRLSVVVSLD